MGLLLLFIPLWLLTLQVVQSEINNGDKRDCYIDPPYLPPTIVSTSLRLNALRTLMDSHKIKVYIVPGTDPHLSEYIAPCDARRAWMTGFTGSTGFAMVSKTNASLWTDGRYWLQAERQMDCNWGLLKERSSVVDWIIGETREGEMIGADPFVFSVADWESFSNSLEEANRSFITITKNLVDEVWGTDRPPCGSDNVFRVPEAFLGRSWLVKVQRIRAIMTHHRYKPTAVLISGLDETAWLLNLRGNDIPYNPFFVSYLLLTTDWIRLFVNESRLPQDIKQYLNTSCTEANCVQLHAYKDISVNVQEYAKGDVKIWIGEAYTNYGVYKVIPKAKLLVDKYSVVQTEKTVKDKTEQKGMKASHVRDAVAVICYLVWLEQNVPKGFETELSGAHYVNILRSKEEYNKGPSFKTISASGLNAALAHYSPNNETDRKLSVQEMYLIDSGGQYLDGSTDITRTVHWGKPTDFQREAYTRVLIGNIDVSRSIFAPGTIGDKLDVWARHALWEAGLNYNHGTGHGIGNFLGIHEWPVGIGSGHTWTLEEGMFTSIEPGYYEDNEFGIRIEDVAMVIKADTKYMFGGSSYLTFEHISLVPYDRKLIDVSIMNLQQIKWLNKYYERIWNTISPILTERNLVEEQDWLKIHTMPFSHSSLLVSSFTTLVGAFVGYLVLQRIPL